MEMPDELLTAAILAAAEAFGLYAQWLRDAIAEKEAESAWQADEELMESTCEQVKFEYGWCYDNI